jgi:glycosyltransferase involved in cell wall biosynthesis
MKKKILCLVQDYYVGGAETILAAVAKFIDKRKFDLTIVCRKKSGRVIRYFKKNKMKVEILDCQKSLAGELSHLAFRCRPSFVYVTTFKCFQEALILKTLGYKILYHLHNIFECTHHRTSAQRLKILRAIYCLSDRMIACSNAVRRQFDFLKMLPAISVIPYGIETSRFATVQARELGLRRENNIPSDVRIVGMVGRVEPQKNQRMFLRIADLVRRKCPAVKFVIIGHCDGAKYANLLRKDLRRLNLRRDVIFTGFRENIPEVMRDIDVLVLPSEGEALNISLIEGMCSAKAVVTVAGGSSPELIKNGETGILAEPRATAFSRAIVDLLKHNKKMARMKMRAQREARKKYSIELFARRLENIFQNLSEESASCKNPAVRCAFP